MTRTNEQQDALLDALRATANGAPWVDPEAVTPTPVPTPIPTPTPGGLVDPLPYPDLPAFIAPPGTDLAKLSQDATLVTGTYTASGDITRNVVGRPGEVVTLALKAGQCPQFPDTFAGVNVTGGGTKGTDVKQNGPKSGSLVHSCSFSGSEGFGLLITKPGKVVVTQCHIFANKSGGIGGSNSSGDYLIDACLIEGNNTAKLSDSNKFTRARVEFRDCTFDGNAGTQAWGDNYCKLLKFTGCTFRNAVAANPSKPWTGADIRGEISDALVVENCTFRNDGTASIAVDEVKVSTTITGCTFAGKADESIECRDDARDGYSLSNVTITGCTFLGPGNLAIGPSGAGNKISLSKNKITVTGCTWPDGKQHVTIKP